MVHEQKLFRHVSEEQALKIEGNWKSDGGRRRGGSYSRGRGGYQSRGRGSSSYSKENVECYKCHKKGHYKSECPDWEKNANYAELEEDVLLMAHVEIEHHEEKEEHVWFLDSGCSNHMCGTRRWFGDFDESYCTSIKLGDDRRMTVEGRGNLSVRINGVNQIITSVYYVPGLKNNLLSVGQLQQRGLKIIIENDACEIWHKQQRRLLMQSSMSKNRMFVIRAQMKGGKDEGEEKYMQVTEKKEEDLWHKRLGHLNHKGMHEMVEKQLVRGLPSFESKGEEKICEICLKGKQNRESIPKKSTWKSSRGLQLVHTYICGPINPRSTSGKRYMINFIDDYSRKCWSYFIEEKLEALQIFKEFKAVTERELGQPLVCLRSDRGGEYNSKAFEDYCKEKGIKRQLTTAYTPQQNGIAERKNRTVMNMTRCMLMGMSVPRVF